MTNGIQLAKNRLNIEMRGELAVFYLIAKIMIFLLAEMSEDESSRFYGGEAVVDWGYCAIPSC